MTLALALVAFAIPAAVLVGGAMGGKALFKAWELRRSADRDWSTIDAVAWGTYALLLFSVIFCFSPMLISSLLGLDPLSNDDINDGRPCTATILSMTDMNSSVNRNEVFEFRIRVQPSEGAAYETTIRDALNSVEGGRVGAGGTEFPCVIDRDDRSRVKVLWLDATALPR